MFHSLGPCKENAPVGVAFAADVVELSRQLVLVLRECTLSSTLSLFLGDKKHVSLHSGLIQLCIQVRPLDGPHAVFLTDPAPSLKALLHDTLLARHQIALEIGQLKNQNKNPWPRRPCWSSSKNYFSRTLWEGQSLT